MALLILEALAALAHEYPLLQVEVLTAPQVDALALLAFQPGDFSDRAERLRMPRIRCEGDVEESADIPLGDRAEGMADFATLDLLPPEVAYDLPTGGRRLLQRARGYRHTFVAGTEVLRDDELTGATPGRLIRG